MASADSVNMSFRVDKRLKKQADELFKNLGMNTSVALNMFLTQSVRQQALPFLPDMCLKMPSNEVQEVLRELKAVESGQKELKGYHNVDDFIEDMLK